MSDKSKVRLAALFVTCLIAASAATQAQASAKAPAKVSTSLRSSVLRFGAVCRSIAKPGTGCGANPAVIKLLDRHPSYRPPHYNTLRKLYFSSAAVCSTMRPSKKDGAQVGTEIFWYPSHTEFQCMWGDGPPGLGIRIIIDLPNAGHQRHYSNCSDYGGDYTCTTLTGGIQADRNYYAGRDDHILDGKKGRVDVTRFAHDDAQYYARFADDNVMFFKIGLALGLPMPSAD